MQKGFGYLYDGKIYDWHGKIHDHMVELPDALKPQIFRHSLAHTLVMALRRLYGMDMSLGVGPVTDHGFFHDVQLEHRISTNDFETIENEMKKIINEDLKFSKHIISRDEYKTIFHDPIKHQILTTIPEGEEISVYMQAPGVVLDINNIKHPDVFVELCQGPHVVSTGFIPTFFKLTKVSEVVWKGQKMQRVEGVGFLTQEQLDCYEQELSEQQSNDHRVLGRILDLFSFSPVSPGFVFWHKKGRILYSILENYIRDLYGNDYDEIVTPMLLKQELWQKTGHLEKYKENMFLTEDLALKPMNCPGHALYVKSLAISYKALPLRIAEFGSCFRNEEPGAICGLKRARFLKQDDGHIFCTAEQIQSEVQKFLKFAMHIYEKFGFTNILCKVATRPEKYIGDEVTWSQAENAVINGLKEFGINYLLAPGDGAFYGPKIELHLGDNMGKFWQLGTIQVDFYLGENLDVTYQDQDDKPKYPVVLHRAVLGSLERFIAILLEHHKGQLPYWLNPQQVVLIAMDQNDYINEVENLLLTNKIRVHKCTMNESLGKRLKTHLLQKPYSIMIIGKKEVENQQVTIRINNENILINFDQIIEFYQLDHKEKK